MNNSAEQYVYESQRYESQGVSPEPREESKRTLLEPRRAFYVGRFQMLHNGHLGVLKFIESQNDVDELVIGIGSSQYNRFNKSFEAPLLMNPFTFEERKAYIERVLQENTSKPYRIYGIMDQHDHDRWMKYLFTVIPKVKYIYTNTKREIETFSKAGHDCRRFPLSENYNATLIRELMANDGPWEQYVPTAVKDVIKEKKLDRIVKDLFAANPEEVDGIHQNRIRRGELSYDDFLKQESLSKKLSRGASGTSIDASSGLSIGLSAEGSK